MQDPNILSLKGKRQDATVLFSDIRGFTTLSESMPPEQVIQRLNRYFGAWNWSAYGYVGRWKQPLGLVPAQQLDLFADRNVIRPVQFARTQILVGLVQVAIAGHQDAVAVLEEGARVHELAIAVDDETGIVLHDRGYTERLGQLFRQRASANIDGEVTAAGKRVEAHVAQ